MNRRMFLAGSAGAAAAAALGNTAFAQAPAPATGVQMDRYGQPIRGRGPGTPAHVPAAKLERVNIMTYDFSSMLKFPWTQNPTPQQTINFLDLPQMYQDYYGLNHIEFQHSHLVDTSDKQYQRPPDPVFLHQVRARMDAAKVIATQINIEIGQIPNLSGEAREKWMVSGKQWVDAAPILGVPRLMLNQEGLNQENQENCISVWKEIQDYARPKGIKISCETRPARRGAGGVPVPPTDPKANYLQLAEIVKAAGGYSNIDIGNLGIQDQATLNDAVRVLYPSSSGNMHIKSSPFWDIGATVRYSESLGYRGHYSIEVDGHPAVRQVYDIILANVTNPLTE